MPLDKSGSKAAFGNNVSAEVHAGKPLKQALAIAYSTQRAPKMAGGGGIIDLLKGVREFLSPSVVKPRGGNWMHYEVPGVDPGWAADHPHVTADVPPHKISGLESTLDDIKMGHPVALTRGQATDSWVDKQMRRYLQTNWGTEQDPLADMLVRGELPSYNMPGNLPAEIGHHLEYARRNEDPRDYFTAPTIQKLKALPQTIFDDKRTGNVVIRDTGDPNPRLVHNWRNELARQLDINTRGADIKAPDWVHKLPPDTPLYDLHVDEGSFSNAMHENLSRLFDYFNILRPEQINNLSVPDAFRNSEAWHAAQAKKMTEDPIAAGGAELHKEYPTGFKWLKLNSPEALDAEGKMMGHCVGSYCDQVKSGNSTIYSLRDPQGRAHVTVEAAPPEYPDLRHLKDHPGTIDPRHLTPEELRELDLVMVENGLPRSAASAKHAALEGYFANPTEYPGRWISPLSFQDPVSSIRQIKGKQNAAPIKDYLPYVQDLVKSGQWGKVGDLRNTGLIDLGADNSRNTAIPWPYSTEYLQSKNAIKHFGSGESVLKAARENFGSSYVTPEEFDAWIKPFMGEVTGPELDKPIKNVPKAPFAKGGVVKRYAGGGVADAFRSVGLDSVAQALEDSWTDAPEVHRSLKPSLGGGALEALSGMNVPFRMVGNKADELGAPPALSAAAEVLPNLLTYGNTAKVAGTAGRLIKDVGPKMVDKFMAKSPLASMALEPSYVVKPRGGNWMHYDLPDGAQDKVSGLDENIENIKANMPMLANPHDPVGGYYDREKSVTSWINKQMRRYLQTNWGTEQDPLADMLVRGELPHYGGDPIQTWLEDIRRDRTIDDPRDAFTAHTIQKLKTLPQEFGAQEGYSGKWRGNEVVRAEDPGMIRWSGNLADQLAENYGGDHLHEAMRIPDWVHKLPADASLYDLQTGPGAFHDMMHENLGRLFDYFRTLRPEQVNNLSVPDAFRNSEAWHAAQAKKMTDDPIAAGGAELHKEYPDKFKWLKLTSDDALDAEGKMMGHCVGSYCQQVKSGNSQIYSLRDPQGRAHVTVEANPPRDMRHYMESLPDPDNTSSIDPVDSRWRGVPTLHDRVNRERRGNGDYDSYAIKLLDQLGLPKPPMNINQIKGKQNKTPVGDYIPYVQDFIKNGKWGDVRDLHNAEMFSKKDYGPHDLHNEYGDAMISAMDQKGLGALTKDASNRSQLYQDVWAEAKKNMPDNAYYVFGDPGFNDIIHSAISKVVDGYAEVHAGPNARHSKLKPPKFAAGGLVAKVKEAAAQTTVPTKAQAKSGKYKKGEVKLPGLPTISIENPVGSIREGKTAEGKAWKTEMVHHYGELDGPTGADGDKVDVFIGPDLKSKVAFVIHQLNEEGDFDEHKVMVGFKDEDAAKKGYLANYQKGWNGMGPIVELAIPELAKRLKRGDFKKPLRLAAGGLIQGEYLHPAALEHLALYLSTGS